MNTELGGSLHHFPGGITGYILDQTANHYVFLRAFLQEKHLTTPPRLLEGLSRKNGRCSCDFLSALWTRARRWLERCRSLPISTWEIISS